MKKTIRILIFIVAIGIMASSGYKLWDIYSEYKAGEKFYDAYIDKFVETIEVKKRRECWRRGYQYCRRF